ncbi:MAG: threonine synthase, partial [Candidatus Omnitrophica bacterium]|nr:threonine synthase [Candidatus Omnitrophota bacterium]
SDKQLIEAYKLLAVKEGVFVEPASAASVAGLLKLAKRRYFSRTVKAEQRKRKIVCILTGHGLKDPECAIKTVKTPKVVSPDLKVILKEVGY